MQRSHFHSGGSVSPRRWIPFLSSISRKHVHYGLSIHKSTMKPVLHHVDGPKYFLVLFLGRLVTYSQGLNADISQLMT